jgi:integrase
LTRFNRPKKASTLTIDVGRIERHIKPLIGSVLVSDVDSRMVKKLIQDITVGKTATTAKTKLRGKAVVTGGAGTAARVADLLSGILTWAIDEGYIERNPVHKVRRFRGEPRDRFLSRSELAALGQRMRLAEDDDKRRFHPYALLIIRLLSLTGCRSSEITALKWSELDLEQKCLRLADSKSGKSLRAIGTPATNILLSQPRHVRSPFVFPGAKGTSAYQGLTKEARRLFQSAGLADVSCHTLRHTFASVASGLGYSDGTIAGLLGHRGGSVTSRYVHRPDAALASAAEAVCQSIDDALGSFGAGPIRE